jgi:RimJ/RimL family protein N-acetyltransferase
MADGDLLLEWANDPMTRSASFHTETIDRASHLRWLEARLDSPGCRVYVGLAAGTPVGVVRVESKGGDEPAEVSITVAPEARGRGLGRALLVAGLDAAREDLDVATFRARVRPSNPRSISLFTSVGFRPAGSTTAAGQEALEFTLP